jgi:hypothetical protein
MTELHFLVADHLQKWRRRIRIIKKAIILTMALLVLGSFPAVADPGVPQVPETQGFVTSTAMSAIGTVTETDSIVTQIINNGALGIPPSLPLVDLDTIYTSTYAENTIADQGLVTYTKGMTTDTSGATTSGLYNVHTSKVLEFLGTDNGRMISEESTVLDGAGMPIEDEDILICPFASGLNSFNPAFCNIVQEGSSVDLTLGSLTTSVAQRYILPKGESILLKESEEPTDLPISDPGVESDYSIKLTGFGDVPAMGSAHAYINVHVQEARFEVLNFEEESVDNPKAEDLVYSESTTAAGDITLFQKVVSYNSKITAPGSELIVPNRSG